MIFVDTSVWIDFLMERSNPEVDYLLKAIEEDEESIAFSGIVLQELFQGIASQAVRSRVEASFLPFVELVPSRETYLLGATLFRDSRKKGHQIRSSIDCLIAACCIEQKVPLLSRDRDFRYLSEVSRLRLVPVK